MILQNELTVEEAAKLAEESVGVIELTDEMLQLVSGGTIGRTTWANCPHP